MAVDPHVKPKLVDRPRSGTPMPPARSFVAGRPGDVVRDGQPLGHMFGSPGPDLGYALVLAERFTSRIEPAPHEHEADIVAAATGIAMRRAATFGRAPMGLDVEFGLTILGYLGGAPADLIEWRVLHVSGASHEYAEKLHLVNAVKGAALRLAPAEVRERLGTWRDLFDL